MKKDVSVGVGVCVMEMLSAATQSSTDTEGQAGKPEWHSVPAAARAVLREPSAPWQRWVCGQDWLECREETFGIIWKWLWDFYGEREGSTRRDMGIAWLCGGEQGEAVCVCVSAENVCNGLCDQLCVSVWYAGICLCTCWEYGLSLAAGWTWACSCGSLASICLLGLVFPAHWVPWRNP